MQTEPLEQVDRYRVVSDLGRGGMGEVFLAERADGEFRQRVAIKVLSGGPARGEQLVRRFRTERQILAALDHPGIAKLLDGGTLADGTPYLVMEYVEGERIDRFCRERGLPPADRVRLVLEVCAAVESAHQRLVVHRDLKPGNILVTADGRPKLLDFGIAKLLDPLAFDLTVAETERGVSPLTLRYASPEQVRGEPIGTASDVYSLGVVLYELLAGRSPYAGLGRTLPELSRAICEADPLPPSLAASLPEEAEEAATLPGWTAAAPAGAPPEQRRARPDRDLDAITLRALRKEPAERYASIAALAEDLRRFLDGRPVEARRGTAAYRAGKFLRRHRWAIAAAAAFALVLAGWGVSLRRQLERTLVERDKAREVARFLAGLFEVSDPDHARGATLTAREILDQGSARVQRELADQPEVRAALFATIGRVYRELGLPERAEPLLAGAVELVRSARADPSELASALDDLAMLRQEQARTAEAEGLYRESLALYERLEGRESENVARLLNNLGALHMESGEPAAAETELRDALAIRTRLHGPESEKLAETTNNLALLFQKQGRYAEAEPLYRESLALRRAAGSPGRVARALNNLALLYDDQGRYAEAEPLYREAMEIDRRVYGPESEFVAIAINNLAAVRYSAGDLDEAERLFRQSFEIRRKTLGPEHPLTAITLGNATFVLVAAGRFAEAEPLLREVLRIHRATLGAKDPDLAITLRNLASLRFDRGDAREARSLLDEALTVARASLPEAHPLVAGMLARRATLDLYAGDPEAARQGFEAALARQDTALPADHPDRVEPAVGIAQAFRDLGRIAEAEAAARRAVELAHRVLPAGHWQTALAEAELAACSVALGRPADGVPALEGAVGTLERRFGAEHARASRARRALAAALAPRAPR